MHDNKQNEFTRLVDFGNIISSCTKSVSPKLTTGFTLIELILVVAMIGLIALFSVTLGSGFLWRTDLSSAEYLTVTSLRQAQLFSQASVGDSSWGVHIENNILTLFQGPSFQLRDVQADEEHSLGSVTTTEPVDIIYSKFFGQPNTIHDISLTAAGETTTITMNQEGTIQY